MPQKKNPKTKQLRKARKILKFWFKAMLSTDLMNRPEHRSEYLEALQIVKDYARKA